MTKILQTIYYSFLLLIVLTVDVRAYIDPSVTTYAIQAIAGIVIGLSAFINIYWRRIARKLKISDSYQETESDCLYFEDPVSGERLTVGKAISENDLLKKKKGEIIKDILLAVTVSFALIYLLFGYGPIEIYSHNSREFWFDIYIMLQTIVPVFFVLWFGTLAVLFLVRKKNQKFFYILCDVIFAVFLICFIQGTFFVYHMPSMDGTTEQWAEFVPDMLISGILTIAVVGAVITGFRTIGKRFNSMMTIMSGILSLVLVGTTISFPFTTYILDRKLHYIVTDNENMVLGNQKNFLILLLDAVDSRTVQDQLAEDPQYYSDSFADFMYYPNTSGAYSFTQEAVPFIINGEWFENQEDFFDFQRKAMKRSPLLNTLEKDNWRIDYYDHDLIYMTEEEDMGRFHNVYHYDTKFKSPIEYTLVQLRLTLYKYAPFYIKPFISYDLKSFMELRKIPEGVVANSFYYSDVNLYHQLQEEGFSVDPDLKKAFKFYHLDGAHVPFEYDEDLNIIESGTGSYDTDVKVSMKVAAEFIKELKESGMYDDTAVIIIADHGYANQGYEERANPLLMVKGLDEHHDFTVSKAPISFDDLQDLYTNLLAGKTGNDQFVWKEGDKRTRRFIGYLFTKEYDMTEYYLEGDASDLTHFYPTGKKFILEGH